MRIPERLSPDNLEAERALRGIAVGRRNWLFCGSNRGGRAAAVHFILIASCARHELDPFTATIWTSGGTSRTFSIACSAASAIRPRCVPIAGRWNIPEAIRPHRVEEVRYRAEAKTVRRAQRRLLEHRRS